MKMREVALIAFGLFLFGEVVAQPVDVVPLSAEEQQAEQEWAAFVSVFEAEPKDDEFATATERLARDAAETAIDGASLSVVFEVECRKTLCYAQFRGDFSEISAAKEDFSTTVVEGEAIMYERRTQAGYEIHYIFSSKGERIPSLSFTP